MCPTPFVPPMKPDYGSGKQNLINYLPSLRFGDSPGFGATMAKRQTLLGDAFFFNERFLFDHAGHIVTDPKIAIIELIANSYDAGARKVNVRWPEELGGVISVTDDG